MILINYEDEVFECETSKDAKRVIGNICYNNILDGYCCLVEQQGNEIFITATRG